MILESSSLNTPDVTWDLAPDDLELCLEVFIGIIASCIPTVLPAVKLVTYRARIARQLFVYGNLWFQRPPHRVWGHWGHNRQTLAAYAYPFQSRGRRTRVRPNRRVATAQMHTPLVVQRTRDERGRFIPLGPASRLCGNPLMDMEPRPGSPDVASADSRLPERPSPCAIASEHQRIFAHSSAGEEYAMNCIERGRQSVWIERPRSLPSKLSSAPPELPLPVTSPRQPDGSSSFLKYFIDNNWLSID